MHAFSFVIACLAAAAVAAPIRDQLSAPRVNQRDVEEAAPTPAQKSATAVYDNGYVPKMPW
jgi:hypothetical protein